LEDPLAIVDYSRVFGRLRPELSTTEASGRYTATHAGRFDYQSFLGVVVGPSPNSVQFK